MMSKLAFLSILDLILEVHLSISISIDLFWGCCFPRSLHMEAQA